MYELTSIDDFIDQHVRNFGRSLIGFEPTLRRLSLGGTIDNSTNYPPYNLERLSDNRYRIVLAVAGFAADQIDISLADDKLTISGSVVKEDTVKAEDNSYLYKGIAERNFSRSFVLADHVSVVEASLENGLLTIELLQEVPEALKPRKISITQKTPVNALSKASSAKISVT